MPTCPGCHSPLPKPVPGRCPVCGERLAAVADESGDTCDYLAEDFLDSSGSASMQPAAALPLDSPRTAATDLPDHQEFYDDPSGQSSRGTAVAMQDEADPVRSATTATPQEIESLWDGALEPDSDPMVQLKPAYADAGTSRVMVRSKRLVRAGEPTAPDAEFELLSLLGEGGMGTVYEARQASVDRTIAVKMIKPHLAGNPQQRDKFLAEAAVTGDLDHPNIVPIHDLGASADGVLYYAMKRVRGTPWSKVLRERSLQENLETLLRAADAVAFAHSKGVIHRDLKPQNVMLGEFGEVLVMDWGLAAAVREDSKAPRLTRANAAGGTPAYMAPEMALADVSRIGIGSDIYLLGAMLFEVITGRRPHGGGKVLDCLIRAADNRLEPADGAPPELLAIALKAMATDPVERYASVKEFQQAIRDYQAHLESLRQVERARQDLEEAQRQGEYRLYAEALFGMRQAFKLWDGNDSARAGVVEAELAYARHALAKDDLDLAQNLLDADEPEHRDLLDAILQAQAARRSRRRLLTVFRTTAVTLAGLIFLVLTVSYILIRDEKARVEEARASEQLQRVRAENEREDAIAAREAESEQRRIAEQQRQTAEAERARAEEQRAIAEANRRTAEAEKEKALAARRAEEEQRRQAEESRNQAQAAEQKAVAALEALVQARDQEEQARARAQAAELMAAQVQDELSRTGMLLDNAWWTFPAEQAAQRQTESAQQQKLPKTRTLDLAGEQLELVLIPAGAYVMGSPPEEQKRAGVEYLHRVDITYPFYMAAHELTEAAWAAITAELPRSAAGREPSGLLPVTEVSWTDIQTLLLPKLAPLAPDGYVYDLPTEAEWEYACRAGTAGAFWSGDSEDMLASAGWYLFTSGRQVRPVGTLRPNPWGLYDMHGNVGEWVRDQYDAGWYLKGPRENPVNDADGNARVTRGGGCLNLSEHCRSAYRSWAHPANRYKFLGLRLVLRPVGVLNDGSQIPAESQP